MKYQAGYVYHIKDPFLMQNQENGAYRSNDYLC